jgi:hypothetical protein
MEAQDVAWFLMAGSLAFGGGFGLLFGVLEVVAAEFFLESFDAAGGVNVTLLTGEEWVAIGANLDDDLGFGGPGLERVSATAGHLAVDVIGMDAFFHGQSLAVE